MRDSTNRAMLLRMKRPDPLREGFRLVLADPAVYLIELLWRWSFGLGALAVLFVSLRHVLDALILTDADEAMLASRSPQIVLNALAGLMEQVGPQLANVLMFALPTLAVLWCLAATIGRGLTTRVLVRRLAYDYGQNLPEQSHWPSMLGVHVLRVVMGLLVFIGYTGASYISSSALGSVDSPNILVGALMFLMVFVPVFLAWTFVNWGVSMAPIFVVRDGSGAIDSVAESIRFCLGCYRSLAKVAIWNALLRTGVAIVLSFCAFVCAPLAKLMPIWAVGAFGTLLALAYFMASDYLLLARLGGYAAVALQQRPEERFATAEASASTLNSPAISG